MKRFRTLGVDMTAAFISKVRRTNNGNGEDFFAEKIVEIARKFDKKKKLYYPLDACIDAAVREVFKRGIGNIWFRKSLRSLVVRYNERLKHKIPDKEHPRSLFPARYGCCWGEGK